MKVCTKCKIEKGVEEFSKCRSRKDGHSYICKVCDNKRKVIPRKNMSLILTKTCNKCKIEQNKEAFRKTKDNGLSAYCRPCDKEISKNYCNKNKERLSELNKNWCKRNAETIKVRHGLYYLNNKKNLSNYSKKWRLNNPDLVALQKERRSPEKIKKLWKDYSEKLNDTLIKCKLKSEGYPQELINNPEIIELKRIIIKTKRLCKTKLQESK